MKVNDDGPGSPDLRWLDCEAEGRASCQDREQTVRAEPLMGSAEELFQTQEGAEVTARVYGPRAQGGSVIIRGGSLAEVMTAVAHLTTSPLGHLAAPIRVPAAGTLPDQDNEAGAG
jgi:hypothetical protein